MLREEVLELAVLFGEGVLVAGDAGEFLLEIQNFLLERLDVQFFSLAVRSGVWLAKTWRTFAV